MANKRKAQEAFGKPQSQLSAFAAAKLARQFEHSSSVQSSEREFRSNGNELAVEAATVPYDGHHSGASTPEAHSIEYEPIKSASTTTPRQAFSTWIPTERNVIKDDDQCLEIVLRSDESVTLIGEYDVEVLNPTGLIVIAGAVLRPTHGVHRVYALSTHALPQIRALQNDATICVTSINSGLRKLEKLSPLFRNIFSSTSTEGRSFSVLGSPQDDTLQRSLSSLEIDKDVDKVLRWLASKRFVLNETNRVMAIGAKASGKSTLNRMLSNYIYAHSQVGKTIYMDLDPGQPEFGPPGQLSLVKVAAPILGPPLTHSASSGAKDFKLVRSHTIAATTFKDDPEHYKACVADLINYADESLPVVVNSCGWVSGHGASILLDLVAILSITDVILLEPLEDTLVESLKRDFPATTLHRLPRRMPKPSSRTPADARAMQMMSYFHHRLDSTTSLSRWSAKSVSSLRPWVVNYGGADPGIFAIISYGQSPNVEFLAEVLNGSVVAIVVLKQGTDTPEMFLEHVSGLPAATPSASLADSVVGRTSEDLPYIAANASGINYTLNPRVSHCVGLALIRGIDKKRKELHLISTLRESQITALNDDQVVLVRGSFDPPEWAYQEDLHKAGGVLPGSFDDEDRPWVSQREMVGIEGSVWRLRHPPMHPVAVTFR